ncbi:MAG: methionine biosynthesis protein MetW [Comamonadaceae bacterium]|nr:methionine biosynthesis protein MetW [Comamonadaceae bacterium]
MLDLGCGDGSLIALPARDARRCAAYGVEIDPRNVLAAMRQRRQRDPDGPGERGWPMFERRRRSTYVILSQTLQAVRHTEQILREMLRVGREGSRHLPQLRLLAAPRGRSLRGPHAGVGEPALPVVRHAERALLHHRRLRGSVRQPRHRHHREPWFRRRSTGDRRPQSQRQRRGVSARQRPLLNARRRLAAGFSPPPPPGAAP